MNNNTNNNTNNNNMNKNKENTQIYYLCNNDDKCKKLIELASIYALDKEIKDPYYINKSNEIAEEVINNKIDELTNKLIVTPMTKEEYKKYQNKNIAEIAKGENDFINNMYMNMGMGMGMQEPSDNISGMEHEIGNGMENMDMEKIEELKHHGIKHLEGMGINVKNISRIPKGGANNITKRKSCKKQSKQSKNKIKEKTKNHKKTKRIRKI
jgi:hypothetical protein